MRGLLASCRSSLLDDAGNGRVELRIELERLDSRRAAHGDRRHPGPAGSERGCCGVPRARFLSSMFPDAPIWWPVGYGEQPMADLTSRCPPATRNSIVAATSRFPNGRIGHVPDEIGAAFTLSVNGQPVFVKGVNWIPDDHFLTRITAERLGRRLDQAVAANVNLVRVWGGGIFESDDFYAGMR